MGKVVAESVLASLNGKTASKPFIIYATVWSVILKAIWLTAVYEYNDNSKKITIKGTSGTVKLR